MPYKPFRKHEVNIFTHHSNAFFITKNKKQLREKPKHKSSITSPALRKEFAANFIRMYSIIETYKKILNGAEPGFLSVKVPQKNKEGIYYLLNDIFSSSSLRDYLSPSQEAQANKLFAELPEIAKKISNPNMTGEYFFTYFRNHFDFLIRNAKDIFPYNWKEYWEEYQRNQSK